MTWGAKRCICTDDIYNRSSSALHHHDNVTEASSGDTKDKGTALKPFPQTPSEAHPSEGGPPPCSLCLWPKLRRLPLVLVWTKHCGGTFWYAKCCLGLGAEVSEGKRVSWPIQPHGKSLLQAFRRQWHITQGPMHSTRACVIPIPCCMLGPTQRAPQCFLLKQATSTYPPPELLVKSTDFGNFWSNIVGQNSRSKPPAGIACHWELTKRWLFSTPQG